MKKLRVRRWGFGLLLAVYVAAATPAGELLKLPALIGHFAEHRQENPRMTVLSFVILHYFSGDVRDADYERDMQLPFKSVDIPLSVFSALHFPPEPTAATAPALPVFRKALPWPALVHPPTPYVATPAEPPEA